ncbi:MAG: SLC13 family permease [Ignavibacteriaceae bacterium]|nr:SLC13 family permease [Ignavibacteriaceae bacterium]
MASLALFIFLLTYAGIIFTRFPWLNIDRPSAAFFGAVSMVVFGILTFDESISAIDFNTIALLLGMMMLIAVLEIDGFFLLISETTISLAKTPQQLLLLIIFVTGISSAFLVNDAVVLLFTPVVISICKGTKRQPLPYLIAEIMASNSGSALTITGNPQNILIGIQSNFAFGQFMLYMFPIAIGGLFIIFYTIKFFFKDEFAGGTRLFCNLEKEEWNYASMKFSIPIFIFVIVAFFFSKEFHVSYPVIALTGGSLVLLLGKIKPSKVIKEIDWVLLLFFASLFIVVKGIEKYQLLDPFIHHFKMNASLSGILSLHGLSLILSQVVSNVPFVILMQPLLKPLHNQMLWLALASSSTLAGNFTIIGAMANLIVIEIAKKQGIHVNFFTFLKIGAVVTFFSLMLSVILIYFYAL